MSKPDYNFNFKMKISRSLTDLQNSLDEACRLGLPPNFNTTMGNRGEEIGRDYDYKDAVVRMSESRPLGGLVSEQEQFTTRSHFTPLTNFKFQSRNDERGSDISVATTDHRETYLNVLRGLADNRQSNVGMRRSRSHDAVSVRQRPVNYVVDVEIVNKELTREVRILRQRLVDMDEEIMSLKAARTGMEEGGVDEVREELRRRVETYRSRESELLNQLNEAVATIEEAKYEEMQAMMQTDKTKEELENMKRRFNEFVEDSTRKMGVNSEVVEQEVQVAMRRVREELQSARTEMAERLAECRVLKEHLKSGQSEVERLNAALRNAESEKCNREHSLEASAARAVIQRDETVSHNSRLQAAQEKERAERQSERSLALEEMSELRSRLSAAENGQLNLTQDKINLTKETDDLKGEIARLRQAVAGERRREHAEKEATETQASQRAQRLEEEVSRKQLWFEQVVGEAEEVMRAQSGLIEKMRRELCSSVEDLDGVMGHCREEKEELCWRLSRSTEELEAAHRRLREVEDLVEEQARVLALTRAQYEETEASKMRQDEEMIAQLTAQSTLMRTVDVLQTRLRVVRHQAEDCNCGALSLGEHLLDDTVVQLVSSLH